MVSGSPGNVIANARSVRAEAACREVALRTRYCDNGGCTSVVNNAIRRRIGQ
jgi:hypothetical protein